MILPVNEPPSTKTASTVASKIGNPQRVDHQPRPMTATSRPISRRSPAARKLRLRSPRPAQRLRWLGEQRPPASSHQSSPPGVPCPGRATRRASAWEPSIPASTAIAAMLGLLSLTPLSACRGSTKLDHSAGTAVAVGVIPCLSWISGI